jgi:outer membrane murein-binding lipoprotein Lpp
LTGGTCADNDARVTRPATRHLFLVASVAALVLAAGVPAEAKKARSKLRHEVALLKAKLAQLETQLSVAARRLDAAWPGGGGVPGGICADPCAIDSDGDGTGDCEDFCPCDPADGDTDGDGMADCWDPCPGDADNACIDPCRMDGDADGVPDCEDPCPWDPAAAVDADDDQIPDCFDPCPGDPANECFEPCPLDSDGDGTKDCSDPCPYGAEGDFPCLGLPPGTAG